MHVEGCLYVEVIFETFLEMPSALGFPVAALKEGGKIFRG